MLDNVAIQLLPTTNLSLDVLRADMSKGAKLLYWLLSSLPPTENNKIEVPQQVLADELKTSVSSIGRYLRELVAAGFVQFWEKQIPGKIRSMMIVGKKIEQPIMPKLTHRGPRPPYTPLRNYVLPIDRPLEKCTAKLDAMGEAVLEVALTEEIPQGKDMPTSIDKYCEQYLYVVQPEGFMMMAYLIRQEYNRRHKRVPV